MACAALALLCVLVCSVAALDVALLDESSPLSTRNDRISHSFYFESHGRDDIREWRATILKGAQYIKIDINFQTNETICRAQRQVPRSHNFSNGCFVLVHTFAAWTTDYNSTYDIADWLLDDRNLDVLTLRPIVFQMCLKNAPGDKCTDPLAPKWIALMDEFYAAVQPIVVDPARINSNVQFVFDQLNAQDTCVDRRWAPWNSTWIGEGGTGEDNNNGTNVTFQMVNMETSWSAWGGLNASQFAKFRDGWYAMVAWEPVDENSCNNFFTKFRQYDYVHDAGVILAYNADPSMFHTFTASQTQRYSHFPFAPENSLTPVVWYSSAFGGVLVTVSLLPGNSQAVQLSLHTRGPRGTFSLLLSEAVPLQGTNDTVGALGSALASLSGKWVGSERLTLYMTGASSCVARLGLVVVSLQNISLVTGLASICVPNAVEGGSSVSATVYASEGVIGLDPHLLITTVSPVGAVVSVLYRLQTSGQFQQLWKAQVARGGGSAALESQGVTSGLSFSLAGGKWRAVVSWAAGRSVYAATLEWASQSTNVAVTPPAGGPPVKVGVGQNPAVAFAPAPASSPTDDPKVLLAYGWSFCFNDLLVDDDAFNMLGTKICNLRDTWNDELTPNPVNSYVFASFSDLQAELVAYSGTAAQPQHLNGFATTCGDRVFHGVFDLGFNATVALLPRCPLDVDIAEDGFLGIAALTSITWPTVSFCGNPLAYGGQLILDSFPLFGFYNQSAL